MGYGDVDLLESLGRENVLQVQRFDPAVGAFETLALDGGEEKGADFAMHSGEGFLVHLANPVAAWSP